MTTNPVVQWYLNDQQVENRKLSSNGKSLQGLRQNIRILIGKISSVYDVTYTSTAYIEQAIEQN